MTQGGLKAMEELAKLEEERGTPGYVPAGGGRRRQKGQEIMSGNMTTGRGVDGMTLQNAGDVMETGMKREKVM